MGNTKEMYHQETEEVLLMALMNAGHDREDAERIIEHHKIEAYERADAKRSFNENSEMPF